MEEKKKYIIVMAIKQSLIHYFPRRFVICLTTFSRGFFHDRDRKTFIRSLEELDQLVLLYAEFRNTNACHTNIDTKKEYREPKRALS